MAGPFARSWLQIPPLLIGQSPWLHPANVGRGQTHGERKRLIRLFRLNAYTYTYIRRLGLNAFALVERERRVAAVNRISRPVPLPESRALLCSVFFDSLRRAANLPLTCAKPFTPFSALIFPLSQPSNLPLLQTTPPRPPCNANSSPDSLHQGSVQSLARSIAYLIR